MADRALRLRSRGHELHEARFFPYLNEKEGETCLSRPSFFLPSFLSFFRFGNARATRFIYVT